MQSRRWTSTTRWLHVGGGGGGGRDRSEYLLIGAMGVIIVAALWLAIGVPFGLWPFGSGGGSSGPSEYHMRCPDCGYEFVLSREEYNEEWQRQQREGEMEMEMMAVGGRLRMPCPKEGCDGWAYEMVQCPNPDCGKYYIPDDAYDPSLAMDPGPEGNPEGVCPYCKMPYNEALKKRKEQQGD